MFIFLLHYVKPIVEVDAVLGPHRAFLEKYFASGEFICAGRRNPRTGGVILCQAADMAAARAIADEDPFIQSGVAECEIIEFTPTMCMAGLEALIP